ncbi:MULTISPECIES: hypothetical protein [unclassified Saccharothrix]|uniref:hypothetical protein n=1 Tax=unclassified Saccharothrix TaxID=2593673 RepID=UPI00307EF64B
MGTSQERRDQRRAAVRRTGPPPRRRPRFLTVGRAVLFGAIALLVGGVVKLLVPSMTPLLSAGLAIGLGAVPLIVDLLRELPERRAKGSTMGPFAAAAFVLLVVGGGTAYALSWTIDRITGGETVRAQRLAAPVEGTLGPLAIKVHKVEVTDNFTKVTFTAVNRSTLSAKVSVVDSCRLGAEGAEFRLDGLFDVLREPFFLDVPGGGTPVTQTFSFPGTPEPGRTKIAMTCGSVSWSGSDPKWSNREFVGRPLRIGDVELAPAG